MCSVFSHAQTHLKCLSLLCLVQIRPAYSPQKTKACFLNCGVYALASVCLCVALCEQVSACAVLAATVAKYLETNFSKPFNLFY